MGSSCVSGLTRSADGGMAETMRVVYQSETTLLLRHENAGIKVILNSNQGQKELEHELRVSNYLPSSSPHRKVTQLDTLHDGRFALRFEWVEGITLGGWVQKQQGAKQYDETDDLMSRLYVAIAIAKSVASLHEAGVAHGSIISDNIILSFESKQCSAILIDLSKAVILSEGHISRSKDAQEAHAASMKTNDMKALGLVLYLVLGGNQLTAEPAQDQKPTDHEESDSSVRAKRGRNNVQPVTNMPLYLISLQSALISPSLNVGGTFTYQYQSANDVVNDLQEALKKPKIYLRHHQASDSRNMSVQVPKDSFYGRLSEVSMVKQSLAVVKHSGGQPVVTTVSGYAGAGKTALLQQIAKPIAQLNGFAITCNFGRTTSPDTVLASAFNGFFGECLPCSNSDVNESIRCSIRDVLGEHIK
jgi:serine/threonine protein kinase